MGERKRAFFGMSFSFNSVTCLDVTVRGCLSILFCFFLKSRQVVRMSVAIWKCLTGSNRLSVSKKGLVASYFSLLGLISVFF